LLKQPIFLKLLNKNPSHCRDDQSYYIQILLLGGGIFRTRDWCRGLYHRVPRRLRLRNFCCMMYHLGRMHGIRERQKTSSCQKH